MTAADVKYEVLSGRGNAELLPSEIDGASTFVRTASKNCPYKATVHLT